MTVATDHPNPASLDAALEISVKTDYSAEEIYALLPHRYPFALVDRIIDYVPGKQATGIKNVSFNEPHFQGHFPGRPIMPGVLIVEAMAQVAGILMMRQAENAGKLAYFMSAEEVKWRKPVRPGDVLGALTADLGYTREQVGKINVNEWST